MFSLYGLYNVVLISFDKKVFTEAASGGILQSTFFNRENLTQY